MFLVTSNAIYILPLSFFGEETSKTHFYINSERL